MAQTFQEIRMYREKNESFLSENTKRDGVISLPSGIQYRVIVSGKNNMKPSFRSKVSVRYTGRLINGKEFDSTKKHNRPAQFSLTKVIKGFASALTLMRRGDKWEVFIPWNLGYGSTDFGKIPAYSTLIFEIELVDFK